MDSIIGFLALIVAYTAMVFFLAWPATWLYNSSIPEMFNLNPIEYIVMVRFMILCRILIPVGIPYSSRESTK